MFSSINRMMTGAVAIIAALVLLAGGASIWASRNQANALEQMNQASLLLRNHLDADMMHDAVRADVLGVLVADRTGAKFEDSQKDLEEHTKTLKDNIGIDRAYKGSDAVVQAASGISQQVDNYIAAGHEIVGVAGSEPARAIAMMPSFLKDFSDLEGGMSQVSDAIEKHVADVKISADRASLVATLVISLTSLLSLAMVIVIGMLGRSHFVGPLVALVDVLKQMTSGNLGIAVPAVDRQDELGQLAGATLTFRDQLRAAESAKTEQAEMLVASIGEGLARMAKGDLVTPITAELTGPFAKLKTDFNDALASLRETLLQVESMTGNINRGSMEIRDSSHDLARRTEQQAANLEETAAAMNQITQTVRDAAKEAGQVNLLVAGARGEAERGGEVTRRAVEAMNGIQKASNEISEIISVIDGIAFQTNLLALNAGVEAARAGEAGKGFAVVANEVRALAQRSADAAHDVKQRITASAQQVSSGVSLVHESGTALDAIIGQINEINERVAGIATSADRQSIGLQQVNTAVREMDSMTQQNAAMVEETSAAARSLSDGADSLATEVGRFKTGEDGHGRRDHGGASSRGYRHAA